MGDYAQFLLPLAKGLGMTALLCIISAVGGSIVGLLVGLARASSIGFIRWVSAIYTNLLRGIPLLIILLFTFFALPLLIPGAVFSKLACGAIALTLFVSAYIAEVVRGGLESVPRGQFEAAEALGMNYFLKFRYIIVPQAMRVVVPPWTGIILAMIKDSSLVSVIGFVDLTQAGKIIGTTTMLPLLTFVVVGAIYFVICYPLGKFGRWYEKRLTVSLGRPQAVDLGPASTDLLAEEPLLQVRGEK
ncbi:amino acid ABC transporter permease [Paenarthrobacter sp. DKR-5]|uniref:amino acid ABC transporter permease n=1 Tax=Paenarthrobacter sp. DKR-5 TaxID=2835535 RepID=UPI002027F9F7|nr:amino acid ABC transporter permease [Paenarthrobacter sp. DKR-5]